MFRHHKSVCKVARYPQIMAGNFRVSPFIFCGIPPVSKQRGTHSNSQRQQLRQERAARKGARRCNATSASGKRNQGPCCVKTAPRCCSAWSQSISGCGLGSCARRNGLLKAPPKPVEQSLNLPEPATKPDRRSGCIACLRPALTYQLSSTYSPRGTSRRGL